MKQDRSNRLKLAALVAVMLLTQVGIFVHQVDHGLNGQPSGCAICLATDHLSAHATDLPVGEPCPPIPVRAAASAPAPAPARPSPYLTRAPPPDLAS